MTTTASQARSLNYFRQIKRSVVFKGLAIACSFLSIPLMIHYLGQEQFGVWSTLLSVMTWISFFDMGLGNGLRNKLAESLAKEQHDDALGYISSAYSLIGFISLTLFIALAIAAFVVPWQSVFNTKLLSAGKLSYAVMITGFFIALNFWVNLINQVLNAVQKTAIVVLGQFLCNALSLIMVYVLTKTTDASLLYLATAYGLSMVSANILLSIWFYKGHQNLIPRLTLNFSHVRPLLNMGLQFFAIQVAVLIIYTTSKILIAQLFGPLYVTQYDVVFKLFSIVTIGYGLISQPLGSAYTDAYHRHDIDWIKRTIKRQLAIFGVIFLIVILLIFFAKQILGLWIGAHIQVSFTLVICMGLFSLVSIWTGVFASFLNGVGKMKVSVFVSVAAMCLNIPASLLLAKYTSLHASAVVIGTIIALLPGVFSGPYQTYKILTCEDAGIWGR